MVESVRPCVLIVEDNPTALELFRLALEAEGYRVRSAGDARTAIEQASAECPDLVLQDLLLPDMDGLDLLRALRALPRGPSLPIIAISGFRNLMQRAMDERLGFDATLTKPVPPDQLIELIRNYLPLPSRPEDSFGAGRSLLVVDDDPVSLELVRLRLEHVGFEVRTVSDGASALELAKSQPPDVVLCDVLMPGTDGYELCQALRSVPGLEHVPVVLTSAYYGGAKDEQLARSVGALALVTRTPGLEAVLGALRAAVQPTQHGPGPEPELPPEEHRERVMAQLERQAQANARFAERSALQAAQLSILHTSSCPTSACPGKTAMR